MTPADKIERPLLELLCSWISEAWGMIGADVVAKSFKKTGIPNTMGATDDHLVWNKDEASEANAESRGDDDTMTSDINTDL